METLSSEQVLNDVEQGLRDIGYGVGLLRRNYAFADFARNSGQVRSIDLAAFGQDPPSYRNACFGVLVANRGRLPADCRSLGAPHVLEIRGGEVRRWKMRSSGEPELLEQLPARDVRATIRQHGEQWAPRVIQRARAFAFERGSAQLDFVDLGLLPAIESEVRQKLHRLLGDALTRSRAVYHEHHLDSADERPLFRLIFRLLAAKLLHDRAYQGRWLFDDPRDVVNAVEQHYFSDSPKEDVADDPETQRVAWSAIRQGVHLQNVSVEVLAYIYENTLVTPETRQIYGTHSTPSAVAEYLVRHLPFEQLAQERRRVFEPFAGHAAFLVAALGRLRELLPPGTDPDQRHTYFVQMLSGIEVDAFAREVARLSLMLADYPNHDGWRLLEGDFFTSPEVPAELAAADVVLCNPPFHAFSQEDRGGYQDIRSGTKAQEALLRVLERPPALLGFVLPHTFRDGQSYREARRRVAVRYGNVELLALPSRAFAHSDVVTVVLMAHGANSGRVRLRAASVRQGDFARFLATGRVSSEGETTLRTDEAKTLPELWVYPTPQAWRDLAKLPTLGDVAEIHRGIEYNVDLTSHRAEFISAVPRPGLVAGLQRVTAAFEPYVVGGHEYLSIDPARMLYMAHELPWARPKAIVNAVWSSRGDWVLRAVPETSGLVVYQNFHGIWPTGEFPIEAIAAVLNGPVANAFMSQRRTSRGNRIRRLKQVPLPHLSTDARRALVALVRDYREARLEWLRTPFGGEAWGGRCRDLIDQIDALVLRAYDLHPRVERELLDTFWGQDRPVPFPFPGFFPPDFAPAVPWQVYVDNERRPARVDSRVMRPSVDSPAIARLFAELF